MNESKQIIVAVIGLAHGHIYQMCRGLIAAGAQLKYVYDEDLSAVQSFTRVFPQVIPVQSEEDVFSDREVKLVASADIPSKRAALGIRAMKAGKDFYCAKAPAITQRQIRGIKKTMRKTGNKFFVFYSEFFESEAAVYADKLIKEGTIGKVLNVTILAPHRLGESRPKWFYERKKSGGILIDIGSHQFDQFLTFTGNNRAKILSSGIGNFAHRDFEGFDDFGDVHLVGENGATGYIRVDWFTPEALPVFGDGKVVILGETGYIELRKYIDVGCGDSCENVILVTKDKISKESVKDKTEKPFFSNLIYDCLHRTETAMSFKQTFHAMELAVKSQKKAKRLI